MSLRDIPSIDLLLRQPAIEARIALEGRTAVTEALRAAADAWRARSGAPDGGREGETAEGWMVAHALQALDAATAPSLRRVINATGVIIHTNLGRAPLAAPALDNAADVARGYANLEYDLDAGGRGHRHVHAERLLCALTGAGAAVVVNNNAAATWLVLAGLAAGREVIVSRGELVEIGGGFRVPDIMAQSGATLREVGTTNRTRLSDYAAAINERTALLLRVHPSNFRIEGFTERPPLDELAELAHRFNTPLFEDLGSGWLGQPRSAGWPAALADEPSVRDSLRAGVDLVSFSGDKLLGGPQAGIIAGQARLVDRLRRHPMMRAVRAGKQTYATLETTLTLWQHEPAYTRIPVVRMMLDSVDTLDERAHAIAAAVLAAGASMTPPLRATDVDVSVVDGESTIGGGSAPQTALPTRLLAIRPGRLSSEQLAAALRAGSPPVIARIQRDAVLLDPRTVDAGDDHALAIAMARALGSPPPPDPAP